MGSYRSVFLTFLCLSLVFTMVSGANLSADINNTKPFVDLNYPTGGQIIKTATFDLNAIFKEDNNDCVDMNIGYSLTQGGNYTNIITDYNVTNHANCPDFNTGIRHWTCKYTVNIPDGNYYFNIKVVDNGSERDENWDYSTTKVAIDRNAPTISWKAPTNGSTYSGLVVRFDVNDFSDVNTIIVYVNDVNIPIAEFNQDRNCSNVDGNFNCVFNVDSNRFVLNTNNTVRVDANDIVGNLLSNTITFYFASGGDGGGTGGGTGGAGGGGGGSEEVPKFSTSSTILTGYDGDQIAILISVATPEGVLVDVPEMTLTALDASNRQLKIYTIADMKKIGTGKYLVEFTSELSSLIKSATIFAKNSGFSYLEVLPIEYVIGATYNVLGITVPSTINPDKIPYFNIDMKNMSGLQNVVTVACWVENARGTVVSSCSDKSISFAANETKTTVTQLPEKLSVGDYTMYITVTALGSKTTLFVKTFNVGYVAGEELPLTAVIGQWIDGFKEFLATPIPFVIPFAPFGSIAIHGWIIFAILGSMALLFFLWKYNMKQARRFYGY